MSSSHTASSSNFDPGEFYAIASWLYDTKLPLSGQPLRRLIIGRAYYAALISARDFTGTSTQGKNGHREVVDALKNKDHTAGSKLDSLRLTRHKADYQMGITITDSQVTNSLKEALIVLKAIGSQIATQAGKSYSSDFLDPKKFLSAQTSKSTPEETSPKPTAD